MLITFSSKAHANITMFGDVALQLIKMMGHSGVVPSALLAADVPAALEQLQQALNQQLKNDVDPYSKPNDDADFVSLKHRALPLIELLQSAVHHQCDVLWKSS